MIAAQRNASGIDGKILNLTNTVAVLYDDINHHATGIKATLLYDDTRIIDNDIDITNLQSSMTNVQSTISGHSSQISTLQSTSSSHSSSIGTLQTNLSTLTSAVSSQGTTIDTLNSALSSLTSTVTALDGVVDTAVSNISTIDNTLNNTSTGIVPRFTATETSHNNLLTHSNNYIDTCVHLNIPAMAFHSNGCNSSRNITSYKMLNFAGNYFYTDTQYDLITTYIDLKPGNYDLICIAITNISHAIAKIYVDDAYTSRQFDAYGGSGSSWIGAVNLEFPGEHYTLRRYKFQLWIDTRNSGNTSGWYFPFQSIWIY